MCLCVCMRVFRKGHWDTGFMCVCVCFVGYMRVPVCFVGSDIHVCHMCFVGVTRRCADISYRQRSTGA